MLTLKNRTCVFAGASGQIGRGAVKDLPGQVIAMSNEDSNEELFSRIYSVFGSADVVVSSTGDFSPWSARRISPMRS